MAASSLKDIESKIVYRRSNEDKAGNNATELEQCVSHLNGGFDQITCTIYSQKKKKTLVVVLDCFSRRGRIGSERIVSARTPYTVPCCHATTIGSAAPRRCSSSTLPSPAGSAMYGQNKPAGCGSQAPSSSAHRRREKGVYAGMGEGCLPRH